MYVIKQCPQVDQSNLRHQLDYVNTSFRYKLIDIHAGAMDSCTATLTPAHNGVGPSNDKLSARREKQRKKPFICQRIKALY